MTKDLVTRIRNVFEDTPQIMTWFDEETYVGAEIRDHISGMWDTLKNAANRIEYLERELGEERHSREVAAAKGWEFSDRIKRLEGILRRAVEGYDKAYCRDEVDFDWVDDAKAALEKTK